MAASWQKRMSSIRRQPLGHFSGRKKHPGKLCDVLDVHGCFRLRSFFSSTTFTSTYRSSATPNVLGERTCCSHLNLLWWSFRRAHARIRAWKPAATTSRRSPTSSSAWFQESCIRSCSAVGHNTSWKSFWDTDDSFVSCRASGCTQPDHVPGNDTIWPAQRKRRRLPHCTAPRVCFSWVPVFPCLLQLLPGLGLYSLLLELGDIETLGLCEVMFRRMLLFVIESESRHHPNHCCLAPTRCRRNHRKHPSFEKMSRSSVLASLSSDVTSWSSWERQHMTRNSMKRMTIDWSTRNEKKKEKRYSFRLETSTKLGLDGSGRMERDGRWCTGIALKAITAVLLESQRTDVVVGSETAPFRKVRTMLCCKSNRSEERAASLGGVWANKERRSPTLSQK